MTELHEHTLVPGRFHWQNGHSNGHGSTAAASPAPQTLHAAPWKRLTIRPLGLSLDQVLMLIGLTLLGFGFLMVHSADARVGSVNFQAQLARLAFSAATLHVVLAVMAMVIFWRINYRRFMGRRLATSPATILLIISVCLLVLVLTHFGARINGAKRWLVLPLGSHRLSFEPSELAKWATVLFIAAFAVHQAPNIRSFGKGFLPLVLAAGLICLPILVEDFGTAVLIGTVAVLLMLMAGCRWWHIALLLPLVAVLGYFAVWHSAYRRERLLIFLHPHLDPKGAGYNPIQSLLSFHSGGFWGRGLGNGIQKMGFLPEDSTDFIFSLIAEELGFFGCMLVVSLFMGLTICGWMVTRRAQDLFGKLLAFGATAMITFQAMINVAVVTVTVPTKGIALPLISAGGTGWVLTAAAIGLLMSVERVNRMEGAAKTGGGVDGGTLGLRVTSAHGSSGLTTQSVAASENS